MQTLFYQVVVVGGGSGGLGCAYRLAKNGIRTAVIEKNCGLGGTSVFGGVNCFEPGVSLGGIAELLSKELGKMDGGSVGKMIPNKNLFNKNGYDTNTGHEFPLYPWGLSVCVDEDYESTLARCRSLRSGTENLRRYQFEEKSMQEAIKRLLEPYSDVLELITETEYVGCQYSDGTVKSVRVKNKTGESEIRADYFIDCTGDIFLARDCGCKTAFGTEPIYEYGEVGAASAATDNVNGITYIFKIERTADVNHIDAIPNGCFDIDLGEWDTVKKKNTVAQINECPHGGYLVNMLPTIDGGEYNFYSYEEMDKVGRARVWAFWNYLQTEKNLKGFTLKKIYQRGIRESYRLVGKRVLTENDIQKGIFKQLEEDEHIIAVADHPVDVHGDNYVNRSLKLPYGIPLECTMTEEFENLFVACRGSSFSHIAASSARLIRTMLSLGEGVGEAVTQLIRHRKIDYTELGKKMAVQGFAEKLKDLLGI